MQIKANGKNLVLCPGLTRVEGIDIPLPQVMMSDDSKSVLCTAIGVGVSDFVPDYRLAKQAGIIWSPQLIEGFRTNGAIQETIHFLSSREVKIVTKAPELSRLDNLFGQWFKGAMICERDDVLLAGFYNELVEYPFFFPFSDLLLEKALFYRKRILERKKMDTNQANAYAESHG